MLIKQNRNTIPRRSRVNTLVAATLMAGTLFAAVPANAYIPLKEEVKIKIKTVDLDTKAGVHRVYEYMSRQAELLCSRSGRKTMEVRRFEEKCEADLLESFVADLDDNRVTQYHETQIAS